MATKAGPNIITDGLVLNIDPANVKSYPAKNDSYRNDVSLLLDGTSFTDKSRNNFTVTTYGNAQIVSDNTFGSVMSFDGNGDYLNISDSSAFNFGSADFTVECWIKPLGLQTGAIVTTASSTDTHGIWIGTISDGRIHYLAGAGGSWLFASYTTTTVQIGNWYHLAYVRSGNTFSVYINGVFAGSSVSSSTLSNINNAIKIGGRTNYSQYFNGLIGPLRIVKGVALYTSNFTPPISFSSPARIIDSKGKSVGTLTNGPVFSNVQNGVMSFDGSNDYIEFDTPALVTNNATISFWINTNQTESQFVNYVFSMANGSSQNFSVNIGGTYSDYRTAAKAIGLFINNSVYSSTVANTFTTTDYYKWNHICITYDYSTGVKIYKNGTLLSMFSSEVVSTTVSSHNKINLGRRTDGQWYYNGKLSDVKLYNRALSYDEVQKIYTATRKRFIETPKTIPGLQLWLDGADLGTMRQNSNGTTAVALNGDPVGYWADKSGNGRHATQATAGSRPTIISNARNQKSAISFNGSQWIQLSNSSNYYLGSNDFTIEGMFMLSAVNVPSTLISKDLASNRSWHLLWDNSTNRLLFQFFAATNTNSTSASYGVSYTPVANAWFHVAVVRSGGTVTMYINGIAQSPTSAFSGISAPNNSAGIILGMHYSSSNGYNLRGSIQYAAIYSSVKYNSNFAPVPWL